MQTLLIVTALLLGGLVLAVPLAWIVMLALGNFGFAQFGLVDCIPAGLILGMLASNDG